MSPSDARGHALYPSGESLLAKPAESPRASWVVFDLSTRDDLDSLIECPIGASVDALADEGSLARWFFVRRATGRATRLRLHLLPSAAADEGFGARAAALLETRCGSEARVRPAAYAPDMGRYGAASGIDRSERLFFISSTLARLAVRTLPRREDRLGLHLALCDALANVGVARASRGRFWRDCARRILGASNRSKGLLASIEHEAAAYAGAKTAWREQPEVVVGWERYASDVAEVLTAADVDGVAKPERLAFHHAHANANRLGLSVIDEALSALILARASETMPSAVQPPGALDATERDSASGVGTVGEPQEGLISDRALELVSGAGARVAGDLVSHPGGSEAGADETTAHREGAVIDLHRLGKRDETGAALLDDVCLQVGTGEVVGVIGPAGPEARCLLDLVAGLRVPEAGEVESFGVTPCDHRPLLVPRIALIGSEDRPPPGPTVEDALALAREGLVDSAGGVDQDLDWVLETIELTERAESSVAELETGERRRLALGAALTSGARLLLLENPTSGLDAGERQRFWRTVREFRREGASVLLTSTSVQDAIATADRAAILLSGRLVAEGAPASLLEHWFPVRALRMSTSSEPDIGLLEWLPEVLAARSVQRDGTWFVEVLTRQPRELQALLDADPEFPPITGAAEADPPGAASPERDLQRLDSDRPRPTTTKGTP